MLPISPGKNGNLPPDPPPSGRPTLRLENGGLYERRELTPEEWLERGVQELAARCKANGTGPYASRAVADIAQGLRKPTRVIARLIAGELEGMGPVDFGEALGALITTYTLQKARQLGRTRGRTAA